MSITWSGNKAGAVNRTSLDGLSICRKITILLYPYLYFGTVLHLLLLGDCIGDHHSLKAGVVDAGDRWAREDAMGQDGIHLGGTCRNEPEHRDSV